MRRAGYRASWWPYDRQPSPYGFATWSHHSPSHERRGRTPKIVVDWTALSRQSRPCFRAVKALRRVCPVEGAMIKTTGDSAAVAVVLGRWHARHPLAGDPQKSFGRSTGDRTASAKP